MHDDNADPLPAPIVPLPRRLPADAIGRLIADARALIDASERSPGEGSYPAIVMYRARGEDGTFEAWRSSHADGADAARTTLVRLGEGARIAIPTHGGRRSGAMPLIDGDPFEVGAWGGGGGAIVVGSPPRDGDARPGIVDGFFALGLGLAGRHLAVESMRVETSLGTTRVHPTAFPEGLRRRIAAYLARLG